MLPELTSDDRERYSRHLLIPGVGEEGQRKLKAASVLMIGKLIRVTTGDGFTPGPRIRNGTRTPPS